jgi:hypothetical protein
MGMRPKIRQILEECIELGIEHGIKVAHKYVDEPPHDFMAESIDNSIWFEIDQRFDFERNVCDEVVEGFDHLATMPRKCIVKDCENHTDQGRFTGDLCNPCYEFISKGKGVHSQAYRNAQRKWVGLENKERNWVIDEWEQLTRSVKDTEFNKAVRLCKMLEAKLKELNT